MNESLTRQVTELHAKVHTRTSVLSSLPPTHSPEEPGKARRATNADNSACIHVGCLINSVYSLVIIHCLIPENKHLKCSMDVWSYCIQINNKFPMCVTIDNDAVRIQELGLIKCAVSKARHIPFDAKLDVLSTDMCNRLSTLKKFSVIVTWGWQLSGKALLDPLGHHSVLDM